MKKVLITGASGFIGSYLVKHLQGYEIQTLSLKDPSWKQQPINADAVIHCAGIAHSTLTITKDEYFRVNCELTKELALHCIESNVKHFVYLSTILVYGEGHIGEITKESRINPTTPYAKSKHCGEVELEELRTQLNLSVVRLPLVFGDKPKGNLATISKFAQIFPIFIGINNRRSILYLQDLTKQLEHILFQRLSGTFHLHSLIYSTTDLFKKYRSTKGYLIVPLPRFIVRFLRTSTGSMSKIFGDAFYHDSILMKRG